MYQIKCDDYILYDHRDEDLVVLDPKCKLEVNTVGEASFTILSDHPYYGVLKKLKSIFEIRQDNDAIFRGRMTADSRDFHNQYFVDLEGVLAFTNDSVVDPFSFPADFPEAGNADNIVEYFLKWLIEDVHNGQVEDWQKLKVGTVTVTDPNNYIARSSEKYLHTWDILKSKLFESELGGYLCIRYESDGNYVDYLSGFPLTNTQPIRLGENLLDMQNDSDASETYSAILPIGKDGLTLAGLEDGDLTDDLVKKGKFIYSKSAVAEYGWICVPVEESTWDDVTLVSNLKTKGMDYLTGTAMLLSNTITVKAVDLHFSDDQIQSFRIYRNILVDSPVHGVAGVSYPLTKLDINIFSPQNTDITIGATSRTLIDINADRENNVDILIQSTKNELKEFMGNRAVGGRNLLQKSNPADWLDEWLIWGTNTTGTLDGDWLQVVRGGEDASYGYLPPKISTFPAGDLLLSFDAYSDTATELNYNYIMLNGGNSRIGKTTITTEPTRYVIPFSVDATIENCSIMIGSTLGDSFFIRDIKVERGTMPTDWTPAPEDTGAAIDSTTESLHQTILEQSTSVLNNAEAIIMNALERYVETSNYEEFRQTVASELEVMADQISMNFTATTEQITNVNGDLQAVVENLTKHFEFSVDGLVIKGGENSMNLLLDNDLIRFMKNGQQFGWWDGVDFHTGNIVVDVDERAQFGNFAFVPRSNGSLSFLKVGD